MEGLPRIHDGSEQTERSQETLERALLAKIPEWIRNGRFAGPFTIGVGATLKVQHGLKRPLKGWTLCRPQSKGQSPGEMVLCERSCDDNTITLELSANSNASVTFSLWVW